MTTENARPNGTPAGEPWAEKKVKLKQRFNILNDSELEYEEGKQEMMFSSIREKLKKTPEEFDAILRSL